MQKGAQALAWSFNKLFPVIAVHHAVARHQMLMRGGRAVLASGGGGPAQLPRGCSGVEQPAAPGKLVMLLVLMGADMDSSYLLSRCMLHPPSIGRQAGQSSLRQLSGLQPNIGAYDQTSDCLAIPSAAAQPA